MSDEIPDFCPDFSDRGDSLGQILAGYSTSEIIEFLAKDRFSLGLVLAALEQKDPKNVIAKTFVRGRRAELELLLQDIQNQIYKLKDE
jgi:hypothetical protein